MNIPEAPTKVATSRDALLSDEPSNVSSPTYTVDDAIEAIGMGRFQYIVLSLAGLCWIADSMEMLLLSFIKSPTQCEFNLSNVQAALVTTSVGVGMLIGNVLWGTIGDSKGRRITFIAASFQTLVCGLLSSVAPTYWALVLTRGLTGIGIGGVPIAFSLIMEFLPAKSRGSWGMGLAVFWSLGAVFEALLAMLVMPRLGWRALIALSSAPLALLLVLSPFLPESPRWLAARGRFDAASAVLERAAAVNSKPLPVGILVAEEVAGASDSTAELPTELPAEQPRRRSRFKQFGALVKPGVAPLSFKLWVVWFCAAFTYYGAVVLQPDMLHAENAGRRCPYTKDLCLSQISNTTCAIQPLCVWNGVDTCTPAGLAKIRLSASSLTPVRNPACDAQLSRADYISSLWSTSGEIPGTLLTLLVVDTIGRRALLVYTYAIAAVAFALLIPCPGRAVETSLFFIIRAASDGYFQAIFLYTNELFPAKVRATAMGVSSAVARVGLILTPLVGQYLDNINFMLAIGIYSGACIISVIAVLLIQIETTKRPLLSSIPELQALLLGKNVGDDDYAPFAKDPTAHPFIRLWRLPARIDGRGARLTTSAPDDI